jgi:Lon protease-like protein
MLRGYGCTYTQADGVLLGSVQALYGHQKSQAAKIASLEADLDRANAAVEAATVAAAYNAGAADAARRTARLKEEETEARIARLEALLSAAGSRAGSQLSSTVTGDRA